MSQYFIDFYAQWILNLSAEYQNCKDAINILLRKYNYKNIVCSSKNNNKIIDLSVEQWTKRIIILLKHHHHIDLLPQILKKLVLLQENVQIGAQATITVAESLSDMEMLDLKAVIEKELQYSIHINKICIKPELIGGVFVELNNFIQLDGSHKQRFYFLYDKLKQKMLHALL